MNDLVVKELIQNDCNAVKITEELNAILYDENYRKRMFINYDELSLKMGSPGASAKAANLMVGYLRQTN